MSLNESPTEVVFPAIHYVFVEKTGHFMQTAQACWKELHSHSAEIAKETEISGALSLYQIEPEMVYRAGFSVKSKPSQLPTGLQYEEFAGGKYCKFTLTGTYEQLPEACGRVFEIADETSIAIRDDAWYIENYLNNPETTPVEELKTEIMLPLE